jgi:hypothetical protein
LPCSTGDVAGPADKGVVVTAVDPEGKAAVPGLQTGDVIKGNPANTAGGFCKTHSDEDQQQARCADESDVPAGDWPEP